MTARVFCVAAIVTAAAMSLRGAVAASEPALTPGAVVLLANNQEPAAAETLRRALADPDRDVRRAAARVAAVAHREVYGALMEALKTERDEAVSVELAKAALMLAGANGVPIVEPIAQRAGASAHLQVLEWVARMEPDRFAARLPEWVALGEPLTRELRDLAILASLQHPTSRETLLRAWMAVAPRGEWGYVLRRVYRVTDASVARDAVLGDALASDRPSVRGETIWFVLRILSLKGPVAPSLVESAARPSADDDEWSAFGRELIARRTSNKDAVSQDGLVRRVGERHRADLMVAWTSGRLTPAEKSAAKDVRANAAIAATDDGGSSSMATPDPLAAFLLGSTEAAAACHADDAIGLAEVSFAPEGKAARIVLKGPPLPSTCETVLTAIARLSAAAREDVTHESKLLVVPFSPAFASCAAGLNPHTAVVRDETPQPGLQMPRLVKEVKPDYTRSAMEQRIQGVVELRARLTATGCVASARVTKSLVGELDLQAIKAVLGWQFSPARLNGAAVPMVVDIELTFTLRK